MSANVAVTLYGGDKSQMHSSACARLWLHSRFIMSLSKEKEKESIYQGKYQTAKTKCIIAGISITLNMAYFLFLPCYNSVLRPGKPGQRDLDYIVELKRNAETANRVVFPASLAVTKGILVSFCFCAALTNMLKFSAYPHLSWWTLKQRFV